MTNWTPYLPIANGAVDIARELMQSGHAGRITIKGDRDMTTDLDYLIERRLAEFLRSQTPDVGFLGEEHGTQGSDNPLTWILDPIDGTANYTRGSPLCGISLALMEGDTAVLGVIDLPFLDLRYTATSGCGAHLDGQPISASPTRKLADAIVGVGDYAVGPDAADRNRDKFAILAELVPAVQRIRMHGSAAVDLAWIAEGRIDAMIMTSNKPWDTAAGVIIARESGAIVVDRDGTSHNRTSKATIAANPSLLPGLLALIAAAATEH